MHPLNPYLENKPNFKALAEKYPDFTPYVTYSDNGYASIDFTNPAALRALTTILLKNDWDLDVELRDDRLCPTLSNRLDYALSVLDLESYLTGGGPSHTSKAPALNNASSTIRILDIGTGHIAIYPLLLHRLRPEAVIYGTEINNISLDHAFKVLAQNTISETSIKLLKAPEDGPILFCLTDQVFDVVMCNPPFYGSEKEMKEGTELKGPSSSAVVTASSNESICPGGEVEFVSRMISESTRLQDRATWFTSLIGKYASLSPIIDVLKSFKIDNYYIKSIKQARTTRWIIIWSYSWIRLSDSMTRPENIMGHTTFARLLPPPNRLTHTPLHPPLSVAVLRETVLPVLAECQLDPLEPTHDQATREEDGSILLMPRGNTWSRAARRAAARLAEGPEESADAIMAVDPTSTNGHGGEGGGKGEPILRMTLSFLPHLSTFTSSAAPTASDDLTAIAALDTEPPTTSDGPTRTSRESKGATLALDFLGARDRALFESFWKYLLTKSNLLGKQGDDASREGEKRTRENEDSARGRGKGRGRGRIRIGFAGRGTGARGVGGRQRDSGWRGVGRGGGGGA